MPSGIPARGRIYEVYLLGVLIKWLILMEFTQSVAYREFKNLRCGGRRRSRDETGITVFLKGGHSSESFGGVTIRCMLHRGCLGHIV